ncbi:MAG TPA: sugar ABC transporter substrate-binding protein [Candidatus Atribacteria bacterium]|nr:sugar ABC transporter substrate-binding protein [Candidatus Atribacteria bacterium]
MRKKLAISLLSISLIMLLGISVIASDKGVVYYLSPNQFDEMQTAASNMIKDAVEGAGYTCRIMVAGNEDSNLQMNQLENAITQDPVAIIVAAVDGNAIIPGVEQAKAAGIPVIAFDRVISGTKVDFTSVAGCKRIGIMAAHKIAELLEEKYGEPKGKILDIMGDPGDSYTVLIEEGLRETMESEYPNIEIETKIAYGWEATTAANIADDYLLANPDTDLIFPHSDHMAVSIASVLQTKGLNKNDILLVSTAGMPSGLQLIRDGWMKATVEQPVSAQAEGIAMFLDDIIQGNEIKLGSYEVLGIPAEIIEQPYGLELRISGSVITAENVDDPLFWGNQVGE